MDKEIKSMFSESSTFSKTIFDFLARFPVFYSRIKVNTSGANEITGDPTRELKIYL